MKVVFRVGLRVLMFACVPRWVRLKPAWDSLAISALGAHHVFVQLEAEPETGRGRVFETGWGDVFPQRRAWMDFIKVVFEESLRG